MSRIDFEPWEPEETVGKLWHAFASRLDTPEAYHGAAVDLSEVGGRLAVFFRGLGGAHSVEIRPVRAETSHHRLGFRRRLGAEAETVARASFDGEALRLPDRLAALPTREANAALYLWLTACAAFAPALQVQDDPLAADLAAIAAARAMTRKALTEAPGLAALHEGLCAMTLAIRPCPALPPVEDAVDRVVRHLLGDAAPLPAAAQQLLSQIDSQDFAAATAPRAYKPYRPVPLWPELRPVAFSAPSELETRDTDGTPEEAGDKTHRARRRKSDQAERSDSFILHKFEAILSWAEFLNLNRRIDDDDNEDAKKAADDQDEIGLGQVSKAPATRLKLHLDLAPEDVDRERLSGAHLYPEWEARTGRYLPAHARVLASPVEPGDEIPSFRADPRASRRIRAVKRQFEALRPGRVMLPGQSDGDELDTDAAVRARVDLLARGEGSERVWRLSVPQARDLSVAILLDVSRSTESAVGGRSVIEIEREALAALAWGLDACGDDFSIHAFSSLRRNRVYLRECKAFGEPMGARVEARIGALVPGFYTRLGAAIRHVSAGLAGQGRKRRLLLVITDGKPNDLDHYEGRHGIEDSRMAVHEARMAGQSVYGVTIDAQGKAWFPRIFGRGGYAVISQPDHLTQALPQIYRQLVGA